MITKFTVDYSQNLDEFIEQQKYLFVNPDTNQKHFPAVEHEVGVKELEGTLYEFPEDVYSDEVVESMAKDGKRPATLRELLAFCKAQSEIDFLTVALGSVWKHAHGAGSVAYVTGHIDGLSISLHFYESAWFQGCKFLAIDK